MRRRMGLGGVGPAGILLVVVLLAACGQSGSAPAATVTPPAARLGIPGTPNLATPVTPVGTFTHTASPTAER